MVCNHIQLPLDKISETNIAVVGDYFLDYYYHGKITRISPEAPIPVMNVLSEKVVPGGAANVVNNLCRLGASVHAFGIVGDDTNGNLLTDLLHESGADAGGIFHAPNYHTIVKTRIIGDRNHQVVRLDFNEDQKQFAPNQQNVLNEIEKKIAIFNAVIISDYGKGFCSHPNVSYILELCKKLNIITLIDPKGSDWEKYKNASWITPNFNEFSDMLSSKIKNIDTDIAHQAPFIAQKYNIENLLITRAEQGMSLYNSTSVTHFRAKAQEVYDVSGAGDTVVATLGAMLASKINPTNAVEIANIAAGIVVGKAGTATASLQEIMAEMKTTKSDSIHKKIVSWPALFELLKNWRDSQQTIAITNGCFDIFHRGHASLLLGASQYCDKLIVAINADESIKHIKGEGRPINNEYDRAYVIASLEYVDAVVIFPQDTPDELFSHVLPDVLVKGGEYTMEQVVARKYAKRVELVAYIDGYSTTNIINRSKEAI